MALISSGDIAPFADIPSEKLALMIEDAVASAVLAAPCLGDEASLTDQQRAAAKAILRAAILRWNESGTGAFQQQTAGQFSVTTDTRQQRRGMFWPSELEQLQKVCASAAAAGRGAFVIDTAPGAMASHGTGCSIAFGAGWCSCGADLTGGGPLYGGGE